MLRGYETPRIEVVLNYLGRFKQPELPDGLFELPRSLRPADVRPSTCRRPEGRADGVLKLWRRPSPPGRAGHVVFPNTNER